MKKIKSIIKSIWEFFIDELLIKVFKEFGAFGVITFCGGSIILKGFFMESNFEKQSLLGLVGVLLLTISAIIACFRIKAQGDRDKIEMMKETNNRLAEQLGKNMSDKQVALITQIIQQNQKDLILTISNSRKRS